MTPSGVAVSRWPATEGLSASWSMAPVAIANRHAIPRGAFTSGADLQAAIHAYFCTANGDPRPFIWTKPAKSILAKLRQIPEPSV